METFINEFHNKHTYIKINDIKKVSLDDFKALAKEKPLQIGVDSNQIDLIELLKKAGFILKRKCYDVEVSREDLKNPLGPKRFETKLTNKGEMAYEKASNLVFRYYKKTHEQVSPLTVDYEKFKEILPDQAFYYEKNGEMILAAFLENEEIAYLAGFEEKLADDFINDLLIYLFGKYKEIFFEADNTDPLATKLKNKFLEKFDPTFDTYIKYK